MAANIQQRYSEARLAEVSSIPDLRILDPATAPLRPLYNLAPALVLLAFVASLGAGLFTALGLDRRDPKLRYPHQVTQAMGLSILGVVPHVERRNGSGEEGAAGVIEALRGVRLNVAYAHGTGPLLVSITSPGRSDGKSFVASNLALAFASVGYRTLLIDGDVRRGGLHRILTVSRKPGLTDVLAGDVTAEAALQRTPYSGLSFIGCGSRRHRGPELLSSAAMPRLVASLRPHYEAIIVAGHFNLHHPLGTPRTTKPMTTERADEIIEMMMEYKLTLLMLPGTIMFPTAGTNIHFTWGNKEVEQGMPYRKKTTTIAQIIYLSKRF